MVSWVATATISSTHLNEDTVSDVTDKLDGMPLDIFARWKGAEASIYLDANTCQEATDAAMQRFKDAFVSLETYSIEGISVELAARAEARWERASFPKLVGYSEIATMVDLSRTRVRQLATAPGSGFPEPVTETMHGPLFLESDIKRWRTTRKAVNGRPKSEREPRRILTL